MRRFACSLRLFSAHVPATYATAERKKETVQNMCRFAFTRRDCCSFLGHRWGHPCWERLLCILVLVFLLPQAREASRTLAWLQSMMRRQQTLWVAHAFPPCASDVHNMVFVTGLVGTLANSTEQLPSARQVTDQPGSGTPPNSVAADAIMAECCSWMNSDDGELTTGDDRVGSPSFHTAGAAARMPGEAIQERSMARGSSSFEVRIPMTFRMWNGLRIARRGYGR